ncbi:MAG: type II secretion system protein [Hydrogenovibrio sp.]
MQHEHKKQRSCLSEQRGFTLVEIAIVLVIVGLVLGGVLKGQEMIRGAKIKNIQNEAQTIISAAGTYRDRYNALPGDDGSSQVANAAVGSGNDNGQIETDENGAFWAQLRQAGLLKGSGASPPSHAFGGQITISQNPFTNGQGSFVCFLAIPGDVADILDRQNDDGIPSQGAIQGDDAATNYDINGAASYDLCYRM